ncbi:hypothetical protein BB560_001664 [Smittium megazygosporum]|uniref:Autophagy-related protein 17 n=1 Tax=Smittium megazygosporum TaxID=133381 RepID=A0A2T9ZH05_9FUNG|nr:hypothetical protein BB560_001664 [Smittium megazygosporum]
MSMIQKLYGLKEPTRNGIELARRMSTEMDKLLSDILLHKKEVVEIHPKLSFLISDNPKQIEVAIEKELLQRNLIYTKIDLVQNSLNKQKMVFQEMDTVLDLLRNKSVDKCFLKNNLNLSLEKPSNSVLSEQTLQTLYDYIEEGDLKTLSLSILEYAEKLEVQLEKLFSARDKISNIPEKLSECETGLISIKAQDINEIQNKVDLNIELSNQFKEDHVSLISHSNQLDKVIFQLQEENMDLSDQDYSVLSHDTQEIGLIVGEMEDSLNSLRSMADEIHVKSQQYSSFFEEYKHQTIIISQVFKTLYDTMCDLTLINENVELSYSKFMDLLNEMWNLIAWYQEFYIAYDELVLEMDRRNKFKLAQQKLVSSVIEELELLNQDETSNRVSFIESVAQYLPADLCPQINNVPESYQVVKTRTDDFEIPSQESVQNALNTLKNNIP